MSEQTMPKYRTVDETSSTIYSELSKQFPQMDEPEKKAITAARTLEQVDSNQLTIELVISVLDLNKKMWKDKIEKSNLSKVKMAYSEYLEEVETLLNSASGKTSSQAVISHFDTMAKVTQKRAQKNQEFGVTSPIELTQNTKLFQTILDNENDYKSNLKAADNYKTIVSLFKGK